MAEPLETAELLAFVKTVDARSLSRAAAETGVPRATISRRLSRLEEQLGARLLRRTTRSLVLTDAGEVLYRHARIVLDAVTTAENSVRRTDDVVRGDLRVSVPPMESKSFRLMVCEFMRRYPEVRLQVHSSTQFVDLRRDAYDVAIRAASVLEPGLVARTLAKIPFIAVASPDYLTKYGTPRSRKELAHHRCLMGFGRGEVPQTHWSHGRGKQHIEGMLFSNELALLHTAAEQGLGIALLPLTTVHDALIAGRLVRVLPKVFETEARVSVVYAEREFQPPQVRAFVDAVLAWAPNELGQELPEQCSRAIESEQAPKVARSRAKKRR